MDSKKNVLIVGLGLIGGSYAKALKKNGKTVLAIDKDENAIKFALENNIIDEGEACVSKKLLNKADVIVFALYPSVFVEWIKENQQYIKSGAVITDVTGVKSGVVEEIQSILRDDIEFISAHPMAGREMSGVENSDDSIFKSANYIVVPTKKNRPSTIEWCKDFGKLLGFAQISELSVAEHDKMIGFLSQLTHVIAISLMTCNDDERLPFFTGDSFRDLTRIARINDKMWSELFLMNKKELVSQIDTFMLELDQMKKLLVLGDRDGLREKMKLSTKRRADFDKK